LLQTLFGYDATTSGLVLSPAGIFAVMVLIIVGMLLTRGVDARYLMAAGVLTVGIGNYWMSLMNLSISPWQIVWPRVVVIAGLSMLFAPLNVAAFLYIPKEMRGAAVGLLALLRNEGGSVGTSVAQTIQERREQFHVLRLNERIDPLNPAVHSAIERGQAFFLKQTGDGPLSRLLTLRNLANIRNGQASSLAYFDVFWFSAALSVVLVFLIFLMRRSVAERGAHIAAE
jgi:DHA2 family multidrug resistance protein